MTRRVSADEKPPPWHAPCSRCKAVDRSNDRCTSTHHAECMRRAPSAVEELGGFRISAERRGAGGTRSGDFYTLTTHSPGRIGVVIGDACGSGAEGETELFRILPAVRRLTRSGLSPARLLSELNRVAIARLPLDRFVTAVALELDVRRGVLTAANAAHVPPLVRRAGDVSVVGRVAGTPLGFSEEPSYVEERHDLRKGDVIVLMTDGVLEVIESDLWAMSTSRRLFAAATDGVRGVSESFLRRWNECTAGRATDDMTLLALEALSDREASNINGYLQVG